MENNTRRNFSDDEFDPSTLNDVQAKIYKKIIVRTDLHSGDKKIPSYMMADVIDKLIECECNLNPLIDEEKRIIKQVEEGHFSNNLVAMQHDCMVLHKSVQALCKAYVLRKQRMSEKFRETGEGNKDAYDSLKAIIGVGQKTNALFYAVNGKVKTLLDEEKASKARGFTVKMEEFLDHDEDDED